MQQTTKIKTECSFIFTNNPKVTLITLILLSLNRPEFDEPNGIIINQ